MDEETIVDSPEIETEAVETDGAAETPEVETPQEEAPQEGAETPQATDGRLPKEVSAALKALRGDGTNPEASRGAKILNDAYFREQAFAKYGKPADIAAMASTLERVGGEEGIADLERKAETMRLVDGDIEKGDPGFLDDIIESFPEGFKKLGPHYLSKLYNLDKAAYGHTVAPVIYGTLKNYQLPQMLSVLEKSTDANIKPVFEALKQLQTDLEEELRNAPRAEDKTARDDVSKEREAIYEEKYGIQAQDIGRTAVSYQNSVIQKALAPFLKDHPIKNQDSRADLNAGIGTEIEKLLKGDADYQRHVKAALTKIRQGVRDNSNVASLKSSLTSYINAKMDDVAPRAVKTVWNRRYGGTTVKKAAPQTNGNAPARTGQKPSMAEVVKVPGWEQLYITHQAYVMRGGKQVLVKW